jgi:hypothetical protein
MHRSSSQLAAFKGGRHGDAHKVWSAHLLKPLGVRTDGCLSVQLPTGGYALSEHDETHYALCASGEFSVILRVTEVDHLRAAGDLVIDGFWP